MGRNSSKGLEVMCSCWSNIMSSCVHSRSHVSGLGESEHSDDLWSPSSPGNDDVCNGIVKTWHCGDLYIRSRRSIRVLLRSWPLSLHSNVWPFLIAYQPLPGPVLMYAVISFEEHSLVLGVGTLVWMFLVEPSRTPEMGQDVLSLWCECFYIMGGALRFSKDICLENLTII